VETAELAYQGCSEGGSWELGLAEQARMLWAGHWSPVPPGWTPGNIYSFMTPCMEHVKVIVTEIVQYELAPSTEHKELACGCWVPSGACCSG
jgi:hypothetical protein